MKIVDLHRDHYLELEKLALGAFEPVRGFMTEEQVRSVVDDLHLPTGEPFPLPVTLDVPPEAAAAARRGEELALHHRGRHVGTLRPTSVFRIDKAATARKLFTTDDPRHPGVAALLAEHEDLVGGEVELRERCEFEFSSHELTPEQTRAEFARRGWQSIVGFQTRNVPHRAHEYLQRVALETHDGLFVQPLVGRKKVGDYTPAAILRGYEALIGGYYPTDRVLLGVLSTAMRYAGPREAVFHAIIRRNYGCTHFIVGRDHAGVGGFYADYDAHEMTRRFDGELGIEVLRMRGPFHSEHVGGIATSNTHPTHLRDTDDVLPISGTRVRAMLQHEDEVDVRMVRPEVVAALDGTQLFITEEDL